MWIWGSSIGSKKSLVCVWIALIEEHLTSNLFFFFWEARYVVVVAFPVGPVRYSWNPQTSFFNKIFIKNRFHCTIYTFKNYFATVFLIFSKINSIQMDF